jgi:hypothetical protein
MKLLFLGEGKNDADIVPILVRQTLGSPFEPTSKRWTDYQTHGKLGFRKKLKLAAFNARQFDGMIATLDADNDLKGRKNQLLQGQTEIKEKDPNILVSIGIANPELEAWLLDDHNAVKAGLQLAADTEVVAPGKCQDVKVALDKLIGERDRRSSLIAIAERVTLKDSRSPKITGFEDFLADVSMTFNR